MPKKKLSSADPTILNQAQSASEAKSEVKSMEESKRPTRATQTAGQRSAGTRTSMKKKAETIVSAPRAAEAPRMEEAKPMRRRKRQLPTMAAPERAAPSEEALTSAVSARERIALLAYSFWKARGCQGGSPEEDWFRAEREILSQLEETVS